MSEIPRAVTPPERATFTSSLAAVTTMVGVAVGLGNFWRFPYLVGRFGGAAFVLFYLLLVIGIAVPALMAEWALGRETRRGTVGAFERAGFPFGRAAGWFFFTVMMASSAYYSVAVGWVLCFGIAPLLSIAFPTFDPAAILPPETGFNAPSFLLQSVFLAFVLGSSAVVIVRDLRAGIEAVSRRLVPLLFVVLLVLIARGVTLPGSSVGVHWYLLKFELSDLTGAVMFAALGQVVFSIGLGGTFMVVMGSYLDKREHLGRSAILTAGADTAAGLLAGLAIFPAVFAFGLEPASGPGLIFNTLPRMFDAMPGGTFFSILFFIALFFAALLSAIAAFEVLVVGLTDNTTITRRRAVPLLLSIVAMLAIPPMINMRIFVPWDLTFGSGMQTLGALLAAVAFAWCLNRSAALRQITVQGSEPDAPLRPDRTALFLYYWLRFVVPGGILAVGVWWLLTEVLHVTGGV
jgi:NSS family neurotransmitter:Na+ symporter